MLPYLGRLDVLPELLEEERLGPESVEVIGLACESHRQGDLRRP